MKLTGAMTAIATPMFEDGTVDYESLNNLIDFPIIPFGGGIFLSVYRIFPTQLFLHIFCKRGQRTN